MKRSAPRVRVRSQSATTALALIASGAGWAAMPLLTLEPGDDAFTVVRADGAIAPRDLGLVWGAGREHPAAGALRTVVRQVTRDELHRRCAEPS